MLLLAIPRLPFGSHGLGCSNHSGLIIYLSNQFSYTIKYVILQSDLRDGQFIDVHGENRHPRFDNNNSTLKQFLSKLDPVLFSIIKDNTNVIITGDFNIDLQLINERVDIQKYVTHGLYLKITLPTRSAIYIASLIDQLYRKVTDPRHHVVSYITISNMSDHYLYFSILDIRKHVKHHPKYVIISNIFVVKLLTGTSWNNALFSDPK